MTSGTRTLLCCLALQAIALPAVAEDRDEAERHFRAGVAAQKVEDFDAAIAAYQASLRLSPTKSTLFNLANCLRATHRYPEALEALTRLEQDYAGRLEPAMADAARAQREELLALTATLLITVQGPSGVIEGATIYLDDVAIGTSPMATPVRLTLGAHKIAATHEGYETQATEISLLSGQQAHHSISLEPEATPPPPEPPPQLTTTPPLAPVEPPGPITPDRPPKTAESDTTLGWVITGSGAALLAAGAVTGLSALSLDGDLEKECPGGVCPRDKSDDLSRLDTLTGTTNVLLGLGTAASIVGISLILSAPDEQEQVSVAVSPNRVSARWLF